MVVLSTVSTPDDAERIARDLVDSGLAACVNVAPSVTSFYRWKGRLEREEERLLLIKIREQDFERLRERLVALHPYEVPEVIALRIERGHAPYLQWMDESLGAGGS
jgi:periplasmic divalent cation tolerance protein